MDDDSVYKYIRKLMALPFLPYPEIQPMFDLLEEQAQTDQLGRLVQYIRRQLIESEVFNPRNWCVYKEPVQTFVIIQIAFVYFFLSLNTSNLQHRELLSYLVSTCMALINFLLPSQGNPG